MKSTLKELSKFAAARFRDMVACRGNFGVALKSFRIILSNKFFFDTCIQNQP